MSADDSVVFGVGADPDPHDPDVDVSSEGSVASANPYGPQIAESFEMQGRMLRVVLQEGKTLVRERTDFLRKSAVQRPKTN